MSKRFWYSATAIALLAVLAWVWFQFAPTKEESIRTLRVGSHTTIVSAALDISAAKGYFEDRALRVVLDHQESSKITMPALLSGDLMIAVGSNSAGSFNHLSTGKVQILADAARISPRLLVRKELVQSGSVRSVGDLRGHTIRVPREGSASHFALHRILSAFHVPDSEVRLSFLDEQVALAEFERGSLSAGIVNEPYASEAVARGVVVEPWAAEVKRIFGEGEQHMVLFVNKMYADAHPREIERFLEAYRLGIRDYLRARPSPESHPDVLQIIASYTGSTPGMVAKAEWPWVSPDGKPDLDALRRSQEFFLAKGLLEKATKISVWISPVQ